MGYDISDFETIDAQCSDVGDVDKLIAGLQKRGMKLLMDLFINHTSDQHEWFRKSRSPGIMSTATGTTGGNQSMIPREIAILLITGRQGFKVRKSLVF